MKFTTSTKSCVDPPFLLTAVSGTNRLLEAAESNRGDFAADSGSERGEFFLMDADFLALPGPV